MVVLRWCWISTACSGQEQKRAEINWGKGSNHSWVELLHTNCKYNKTGRPNCALGKMSLVTSVTVQWFQMLLVMEICLRGAEVCTSCTPGFNTAMITIHLGKLPFPCWLISAGLKCWLTACLPARYTEDIKILHWSECQNKSKWKKPVEGILMGKDLWWAGFTPQELQFNSKNRKREEKYFFFSWRLKGWVDVKWTA